LWRGRHAPSRTLLVEKLERLEEELDEGLNGAGPLAHEQQPPMLLERAQAPVRTEEGLGDATADAVIELELARTAAVMATYLAKIRGSNGWSSCRNTATRAPVGTGVTEALTSMWAQEKKYTPGFKAMCGEGSLQAAYITRGCAGPSESDKPGPGIDEGHLCYDVPLTFALGRKQYADGSDIGKWVNWAAVDGDYWGDSKGEPRGALVGRKGYKADQKIHLVVLSGTHGHGSEDGGRASELTVVSRMEKYGVESLWPVEENKWNALAMDFDSFVLTTACVAAGEWTKHPECTSSEPLSQDGKENMRRIAVSHLMKIIDVDASSGIQAVKDKLTEVAQKIAKEAKEIDAKDWPRHFGAIFSTYLQQGMTKHALWMTPSDKFGNGQVASAGHHRLKTSDFHSNAELWMNQNYWYDITWGTPWADLSNTLENDLCLLCKDTSDVCSGGALLRKFVDIPVDEQPWKIVTIPVLANDGTSHDLTLNQCEGEAENVIISRIDLDENTKEEFMTRFEGLGMKTGTFTADGKSAEKVPTFRYKAEPKDLVSEADAIILGAENGDKLKLKELQDKVEQKLDPLPRDERFDVGWSLSSLDGLVDEVFKVMTTTQIGKYAAADKHNIAFYYGHCYSAPDHPMKDIYGDGTGADPIASAVANYKDLSNNLKAEAEREIERMQARKLEKQQPQQKTNPPVEDLDVGGASVGN